ncbi:MAG TPA: hypothetical protein VD970_06915 [Acetobacteraceae bacterium]|nr:hypothetical protein [Acetobacteraceae bacterium]
MRRLLLATLIALPLAPARADEVANAMREALRAYEAGRLNAARTALEEAGQLLAQRSAALLGAALPEPLPGWTAEAPRATGTGVGLLGASQASRTYRDARGRTVEITILADNPLIGALGAVLTSPLVAGALGRLVRVGDQRALQTGEGEIQMLVDGRILVTLRGDAPAEAKLAYAQALDLGRLMRR